MPATAPTLPAWNAGMAELLTATQRACLAAAARAGTLRRTRHGFAAESETEACHQARTVFALERAGLLAYAEGGDTTRVAITAEGRAVAGGGA